MVTTLRRQFTTFLAEHRTGILCLSEPAASSWAMPVRYVNRDLTVVCLLPRWSEIAFRLECSHMVTLIVPSSDNSNEHWLSCFGAARLGMMSEWHALWACPGITHAMTDLYEVIEIAPKRLDLFDQRLGWGHRTNLDCEQETTA
ncbi:MAG TPA: hypothetical protein VIL85_20530 [Thermomicrobiales bacterium]|jgi:hypothetical protein